MRADSFPVVARGRKNLSVHRLPPVRIEMVTKGAGERLWNQLMRDYHELGMPCGSSFKSLAYAGNEVVAALSFGVADYKLLTRDRLLRRAGLEVRTARRGIAVNTRFLILPWIQVRNLASFILARAARLLKEAWPERFGCPLILLETFVDPKRFHGTCYRAANWRFLGHTKGSGIRNGRYVYHGEPKALFVYPVSLPLRRALKKKRVEIVGDRIEPPGKRKPELPLDWKPDTERIGSLTPADVKELSVLLMDFHSEFAPAFQRIEQETSGAHYLAGLLSAVDRKNVERMALALKGHRELFGVCSGFSRTTAGTNPGWKTNFSRKRRSCSTTARA